MQSQRSGILALEDGSIYRGLAFGADKTVVGEVVFNTSMTGYQEILTDPSYFGQIITMTAPQIGNYGINDEDNESDGSKALGLVVREVSTLCSNWRSTMSLDDFLKQHNVPGLTDIDTRALTKKLRSSGAMRACLSTENISDTDAIEKARNWSGMVGQDFVHSVSCKESYRYFPVVSSFDNICQSDDVSTRYSIAAFDFGAKASIFKKLHQAGFDVTIFPADTSAEEIRAFNPDGIFLSNGPGDPAALNDIHEVIATLIPEYPMFGICMGHQIITHALGGETYKLKFGHRGGNHPVKNLETGLVTITSQNHGFAASKESIEKAGAIVTEINLNDNTVEGLRHKDYPVFSVQYHPEAAPGPNDAVKLFKDFYNLIACHKGNCVAV
ncbi:MAG: carbamoyl phosphate synthase small subunit [Verrucomicrobia bacterium CG1_02_43_26]|nr:MAG: carbamoyl phosphate synthase small subunit [Verrucomicrobia bacterium CG1_02_43_26]